MYLKTNKNTQKPQRLQQTNKNLNQSSLPLFVPPIKIQPYTNLHRPIHWINPNHTHPDQQQPPKQQPPSKSNPLKLILHITIRTLSAIITSQQFSAFQHKFKNIMKKSTIILIALLKVRHQCQQKKKLFYKLFLQNVIKYRQHPNNTFSQQQINCLNESGAFIQQFIEGIPSQATCNYFPKYTKQVVFTIDKVQQLIQRLQGKLSEQQFQQEEGRKIEQKMDEIKIQEGQRTHLNPFLIYRRENEYKINLYPVDTSFNPKGINHLLLQAPR